MNSLNYKVKMKLILNDHVLEKHRKLAVLQMILYFRRFYCIVPIESSNKCNHVRDSGPLIYFLYYNIKEWNKLLSFWTHNKFTLT